MIRIVIVRAREEALAGKEDAMGFVRERREIAGAAAAQLEWWELVQVLDLGKVALEVVWEEALIELERQLATIRTDLAVGRETVVLERGADTAAGYPLLVRKWANNVHLPMPRIAPQKKYAHSLN